MTMIFVNFISTNRNGSTILTFTDNQWEIRFYEQDGIGDTSKPGCIHFHMSFFGLTQESEIGKGFGQSGF